LEKDEIKLRAYSDPDFSALYKDAIIASARTSSKQKHRVLSFIVEE